MCRGEDFLYSIEVKFDRSGNVEEFNWNLGDTFSASLVRLSSVDAASLRNRIAR